MLNGAVRIKMCGMTRTEDILQAVALGVNAIGLIFYPLSKRAVSIQQAKKLLSVIPVFVNSVAVVVNPEEEEVRQILAELPIQYLQFHGKESPEFCQQFNKPYIKSIPATSTVAIEEMMNLYPEATAFLLDTPAPDQHGGTGTAFDWTIIPQKRQKPILLAGGLDAGNVCDAVKIAKPYAVDVCTGIERSAGIKDKEKMMQFVRALAISK